MSATFTCPLCDMTTNNPTDVREGWCGNCHGLTTEKAPPGMRWVMLRGGRHLMGRLMAEPLPDEYHMVATGEVYRREGASYQLDSGFPPGHPDYAPPGSYGDTEGPWVGED
jgi:hypothetical protein